MEGGGKPPPSDAAKAQTLYTASIAALGYIPVKTTLRCVEM
jgi:hypothetical protein